MKTYYIHFERPIVGTLAVVRVSADSYEEAEYKALKAYHSYDDISEITREQAEQIVAEDTLGLQILDENGNEIEEE